MSKVQVDLLQFQAKNNNRIRGELIRNFYTFDRNIAKAHYSSASAYFLSYMFSGVPAPKFQHTITAARKGWMQLISYLLYGVDKLKDVDMNILMNWTIDDACQTLNLEKIVLKPEEYTTTYWGPRYWKFLHLTSFLVDGRQEIIKMFASLMYIFNLLLICQICSLNYMKKQPMLTVTIPMIESSDPITTIFNLHNTVNIATNKKEFSIEAFCNKYGAQIYATEKITYDTNLIL